MPRGRGKVALERAIVPPTHSYRCSEGEELLGLLGHRTPPINIEVPEEATTVAAQDPMERLAELRESFGEDDWLVSLTKEEMREMIAGRYV